MWQRWADAPVATLLSLSLPADTTDAWATEFMEGYREMSERFGVTLAGGDTTRSTAGIVINVTAIGRADATHIKRRSDARAGDTIFVTGELGASGAGLNDILAGRYDTPAAAIHRNPQPHVAEGLWLGARPEVHAMMDLSDGLASDVRHILERSRCGAIIDVERIPAAEGATCNLPPAEVKTTNCSSRQTPQPRRNSQTIFWKNSAHRSIRWERLPQTRNSSGDRTDDRSNETGKDSCITKLRKAPPRKGAFMRHGRRLKPPAL